MLNCEIHGERSTICKSAVPESKLNQRCRLRKKVITLLTSAATLAGVPFPSSLNIAAKAIPKIGEKIMSERIGSAEMSIRIRC